MDQLDVSFDESADVFMEREDDYQVPDSALQANHNEILI